MKFREQILEAITVDTSAFKRSTGKGPRGKGTWFFFADKDRNDFDKSFEHFGPYPDAVKKAQAWAKENSFSTIYLGT